jgi:hypothetical protein
MRSLQKTQRDTSIGPPKKRRQLNVPTAQADNPFGPLKTLVGQALNGSKRNF